MPLRWDQAQSEEERGIISGYIIERKLDGEKAFVRVTPEPTANSYILDESDVYFDYKMPCEVYLGAKAHDGLKG